ncbi:hypothetical protein ACO0QE_001710 [Hanseniaspora vineae]
MKFGKYLEARQLELPEYNGYFINYKALKKLIKKLSLTSSSASLADAISPNEAQFSTITTDPLSPEPNTNISLKSNLSYKNLQLNKAVFFFRVERELEKVNEYYLEREKNFKIMIEELQEKFQEYKRKGRLASKSSSSFKYLFESLKRLQRDLNHLTQYVELNRTGFAKVLKKWDKRSHSHTKDFYLATVVSVQPVFTRSLEISQFNDLTIGLLMELDDLRQEAPLHYDTANITVTSKSAPYTNTISHGSNHDAEELIFETNLFILSIELEIDTWYKEVNSICQLKDLEPRLQLLKNFPSKVINFINDVTKLPTEENELIIKGSLNKLFYLLVSSEKVDDECLETFFLSCDGLKKYVDFLYLDNDGSYIFTKRNFFHEAAACPNHDRNFILRQAIQYYTLENSQFIDFLNAIDYNGRTPLHYASELGKAQFVESLLRTQALTTVQAVDNNSNNALVLAIIKNHPSIVQLLLTSYNRESYLSSFSNEQREQQSPLNISCIKGNYDIALIILNTLLRDFDLKNYRDVQGYRPLHLAAEHGADTQLLELLCDHGCDPNELDSVNGWTPLIYAVSNGHSKTVESLITNCHAGIKHCDDKHLSPIFYACWQGHIDVLNVLMSHEKRLNLSSVINTKDSSNVNVLGDTSGRRTDSSDLKPIHSMSLDIDNIPDFTLPPPIIPLRKYGHNFLEQKVFLKLHFKPGFSSIKLNEEDNGLVSAANLGRITLTSNLVDLISRNISLPIESSSSYYYTELGFNSNHSDVAQVSSGNDVDSTDEVVFQINNLNNCNIDLEIYPVSGTRMIAKTILTYDILRNNIDSAVNLGSVVLPLLDSRLKLVGQIHFDFQVIYPFTNMPLEITQFETYWKSTGEDQMTSSSLSGEYVTVLVTLLNDGKIVAVPKFTIQQADTEFLLMDLSAQQVESIIGRSLSDLSGATNDYKSLQEFMQSNYICFESLLKALPSDVKIGIKVAFPTDAEVSQVPVKLTSPYINIDKFVDDVLSITLNYIQSTQSMSSKKVVFSSSNHMICSILNWKQPVFPVIFNMNGVFKNPGSNSFAIESQNHLINFALKKDFHHHDFNYRSVKDVVNFAKMNNLLGVIIPTELLLLGDSLIDEIKASGLLVIAGRSSKSETNESSLWNHPKINGIKNNRFLRFKDQNNEFLT